MKSVAFRITLLEIVALSFLGHASFALLYFRHRPQLHFFAFRLVENVLADREIFVGDAVGLKENSFWPRLNHAFGDDFFQGDGIFPAGDAGLARRTGGQLL